MRGRGRGRQMRVLRRAGLRFVRASAVNRLETCAISADARLAESSCPTSSCQRARLPNLRPPYPPVPFFSTQSRREPKETERLEKSLRPRIEPSAVWRLSPEISCFEENELHRVGAGLPRDRSVRIFVSTLRGVKPLLQWNGRSGDLRTSPCSPAACSAYPQQT